AQLLHHRRTQRLRRRTAQRETARRRRRTSNDGGRKEQRSMPQLWQLPTAATRIAHWTQAASLPTCWRLPVSSPACAWLNLRLGVVTRRNYLLERLVRRAWSMVKIRRSSYSALPRHRGQRASPNPS